MPKLLEQYASGKHIKKIINIHICHHKLFIYLFYMYLVHQYQPILESVTKLEKSYFILKTLSDYLINLYKHVNL